MSGRPLHRSEKLRDPDQLRLLQRDYEHALQGFQERQRKLEETKIPVYGNVRPYAKKEEVHDRIGSISNVKNGQPATVGWRYVTKNGQYAMVSVERSAETPRAWAFIEAKYLPAPTRKDSAKENR
jgi:hypothetical protein